MIKPMTILIKVFIISIMSVTSLSAYEGSVTADVLIIRSDATTSANNIGAIYKDDRVNILELIERKDGMKWYRLKNGYVSAKYIRISNKYENIKQLSIYKVIVTSLSIRKEANAKSKFLGKYKYDQIILVTEKTNDSWMKTTEGYVSSKYIQQMDINSTTKSFLNIYHENGQVYTKSFIPNKTILKPINTQKIVKQPTTVNTTALMSKQRVKEASKNTIPKEKLYDRFFVELQTGLSIMSVKDSGEVALSKNTDSDDLNFRSFNILAGYNITKDSFSTIGFYSQIYDDVNFYNYLISYNKKFTTLPYNLYVGALAGVSYIKLTDNHVNGSNSDEYGKAIAYGAQLGTQYKFTKKLAFIGQYQYLKAKHKTYITSDAKTSTLIRDNHQSITIGLRYRFDYFR